jgi:hypothetical protein
LLAQQTVLGSSDGEIQKNAKTLTEGLAAREGLYAFDNDRWNQIFSKVTTKDQQSASVSHDDIKNALKDSSLNLTTDERKALTDIDENFNKLRHHWRLDSVSHTVDLEQLQYDLDKKDDGKRGWLLASVDALQGQAQSAAKDGNVTVNIESGEGWQNVAAKALGYDIRLRTKDDWSAVPQTDINTIYGLANYFKQNAGITMLHPGQLQLQVPEQFQTS